MRIGSGLDVHAFDVSSADAEATVVLAGVRLPSHAALGGHSDADVVAHAVTDALLGAVAGGDMGTRFGVDDPDMAGADSMRLLATVADGLTALGLSVVNLDVTIVAARPRVGPAREAMRANLAAAIGVEPARVSVKATTTDGLGAVGRGEGIAAWATCLVGPLDG